MDTEKRVLACTVLINSKCPWEKRGYKLAVLIWTLGTSVEAYFYPPVFLAKPWQVSKRANHLGFYRLKPAFGNAGFSYLIYLCH